MRFGDLWGEAAVDEYRKAFDGVDEGEAARIRPQRRRELREMRSTDCLVMTKQTSTIIAPTGFPLTRRSFTGARLASATTSRPMSCGR